MRKTSNYDLPQFEGNDFFNKEDLNVAFKKIDDAVGDLQETINLSNGSSVVVLQKIIEIENKLKEEIVGINTQLSNVQKETKIVGTQFIELSDSLNYLSIDGGTF